MTTREEIRQWIDRGIADGATHVIVACDTFDHEDYPVYVKPGQNAREVANAYDGVNMQRLIECYNLSLDIYAQMNEYRARNF